MYTDDFGLSAPPFQLTPDARFWFDSRTHKKAMAYLGYGLAQGEGFIVVTGEIGAGKSTLVQHLLASIDRERLNAISLVSTQVDGDDMLRLVAQGLGLESDGAKAGLLDSVENKLIDEARRGRRTLIVVDEAQNLSVSALEELRMLSNFTSQGRALVQIFLLGQPEFRDKLADGGLEQLRQRVIASHHLEAIQANEVEPYLVHRLSIAGWTGRPAFSADAFAALYRHSGGIPRRLNQLAARLLLHAGVERLETIGGETVEAVVADLDSDTPQRARPRVHAVHAAGAAPAADPRRDAEIDRRLAALEARADEQERAVRRVLTLLVEWVENGQQAPGYTNAA